MALFTLLIVPFALLSPAWSQTCQVIALGDPPPEVRQAAIDLLKAEEPPDQFAQHLRSFLVSNARYVFTLRTQFNNLAEYLGRIDVGHVAIDLPSENILQAEREAWNLMTHAQGYYRGINPDDITSVMMIAVGTPMTLRVRNPNFFIGVRLEGLPALAPLPPEPRKPARSKRSRPHAAADAKYNEVLDQLEDSSSSRNAFRRMVRRLKDDPEPFGKISVSDTKERLLSKFWRPARKPVEEWLDVFYGEPAQAQTQEAPPKVAAINGNWRIYISPEKLQQIEAGLRPACSTAIAPSAN